MSERLPRRLLLLALAVVVAAICVRLGIWQLDRLDERRALNARLAAALASSPVPLGELVAGGADATYRRVTAEGTWDRELEVILYGRSLDGRPGHHVLTPLVLDGGGAVLVDRGWVPAEVSEPPVGGDAAASSGAVTVAGILLPSRAGAAYEELPDQVRDVDAAALDRVMPVDLVTDAYVLLERQTPAADRPIPAPLPEPTEGPHLSYAIQWFTFATIALVGYGLLVRRDRRRVAAPQTASDERKG